MKVFYCAGSRVPSSTANSVHVMRMCEALADLGHEVVLFAKRGGNENPYAYYGVARSFDLELVDFTSRLALIDYLRRLREVGPPDLAVGRYLYPLLWLQRSGIPTIYESHAPPGQLRRLLEQRLLGGTRSQGLVVITKALRDAYQRSLPSALTRSITVLADAAVDPGEPAPPSAEGGLVVGFAGGWYPGRGLELIHELARRLPKFRFRVAGGSDLGRFGLGKLANLECVGLIPHSAVPGFLKSCHVLLAPYQRRMEVHGGGGNTADWCSPMKLFEYMAQGKAIVCSDIEVFGEVLEHGENCLMVDPADVGGWIEALERLDADRALLLRLSACARRDFLARYTWRRRACRFMALAADLEGIAPGKEGVSA